MQYICSDAILRLKRLQREVFEELVTIRQRITDLERKRTGTGFVVAARTWRT